MNLFGEDGFKLLNSKHFHAIPVIVTSANTDRALDGYQYSVLDFVPKPISPERFFQALTLFENKKTWKLEIDHISIIKEELIEILHLSQISYFEANGKSTTIYLKNEKKK